jgi:pimeloyl-[acyl-carrier protein] methyl ester esterase
MAISPSSRLALRALALAASLPLFAGLGAPRAACAQAPAPAAPAAPAGLKLFPDSRMVVRDRISVEVVGSGPDVVLIPGLASSRETWRRTAERLRGRYRLHLVQVAGFAGEPARANASGPVLAPTAADIDGYIVAAGLRKPAVVGHSLGGVMALELGLDHPDHVGKLFVVDALAFYAELFAGPQATAEGAKPYADAMAAHMLAADAADAAKGAAQMSAIMATAPADRERVAAWSLASARPVVAQAMKEDVTTDLRPRLAQLSVPLTVIYEAPLKALITADYAPVKDATLVAAAPAAKHFIMYDDPQGFDAALDAFLAR